MPPPSGQVTQLLQRCRNGEEAARDEILGIVYPELRRLAAGYLRGERKGHTLQPTALVHEAYLRLAVERDAAWQSRAHFIGCAAQAMRHVLVDYARARRTGKRGGGAARVTLTEAMAIADGSDVDLVRLDEALTTLAALNPRHARVVELKFFGGLTNEEAAEVLHIGSAAVRREWTVARAWLKRELSRS